MRVIVLVKANQDSENGVMPSTELISEMQQFNEELIKAGVMQAGEGLHPSSTGARVKFSGNKREVIDGPFAETKELVAGFWLWKVKSLQDAIDWLKRAPFKNDEVVEIRPIFEAEDFGDQLTPALKAKEEALREKAAAIK